MAPAHPHRSMHNPMSLRQQLQRTWRIVKLPGIPVELTALRVTYVTVPLPVVMLTGSGTSDACEAQAQQDVQHIQGISNLLARCARPWDMLSFR